MSQEPEITLELLEAQLKPLTQEYVRLMWDLQKASKTAELFGDRTKLDKVSEEMGKIQFERRRLSAKHSALLGLIEDDLFAILAEDLELDEAELRALSARPNKNLPS